MWTTTPTGLRRAVVGDKIFTLKVHYSRRGPASSRPGTFYRNGWMVWVKEDGYAERPWTFASTVRGAQRLVEEI